MARWCGCQLGGRDFRRAEYHIKAGRQCCWRLCFALPNCRYPPAHSLKFLDVAAVPVLILCQLSLPIVDTALGHVGYLAALVLMPETSVDKYHETVAGQHDIRGAGEGPPMKAETKAPSMDSLPYKQFRFRILPLYRSHYVAAHPMGHCVRQPSCAL